MIKKLTLIFVQTAHQLHVGLTQLKIKDINVFTHPSFVNRFRNYHDTTLQQPA